MYSPMWQITIYERITNAAMKMLTKMAQITVAIIVTVIIEIVIMVIILYPDVQLIKC